MDAVLMVVALSLVALVVVLFFELRGAQRRMDDMRDELESRLRRSLMDVAGPVARIPDLEERLTHVEREVAVVQQIATAEATQADEASGKPSGAA